jgi:hypothetical protein
MSSPQNAAAKAEQLAAGANFEQIDNVYIFTLSDMSRVSIDAWANKVQAVIDSLPEGAPFLAIHQFTSQYATLTPYLKSRSDQLVNDTHPSRTAIIMPKSGLTHMVTALLPKLSRKKGARFFTTREEALDWLQQSS